MADTDQTHGTQHAQQQQRLAPGIVSDPAIMHGRPIIQRHRITVQQIMGYVAGGMTIEQILAALPSLSREEVLHALAYAQQLVEAKGDELSGITEADRQAWGL